MGMMLIQRAAILVLVAVLRPIDVASARASTLCLSDNELRAVLIDMTVRGLGATIGRCARMYPDLSKDAMTVANQFLSKYGDEMKANSTATAKTFFDRGQTLDDREAVYKRAEAAAINKTAQFSLKECQNSVLGLQLMTDADSFSVVRMAAQASFVVERSRVPRCDE
jgi:hypothetical protein